MAKKPVRLPKKSPPPPPIEDDFPEAQDPETTDTEQTQPPPEEDAPPPVPDAINFRPLGTPTNDPHGVTSTLRVCDLPNGRILWVARQTFNRMTQQAVISDAMVFVPAAGKPFDMDRAAKMVKMRGGL
jgi:hypothetical protein